MRPAPALALAALALSFAGCSNLADWVEDRTRTCDRMYVDTVNRSLVAEPVNIASDDEAYADANLLRAGQVRRVQLCVDEGDRERFRAGRGGVTLHVVNCVVLREDYQREYEVARVVWDNEQLYCENW